MQTPDDMGRQGKSCDLSIKEKKAKKTLHIVYEKGHMQDTVFYVRAWLQPGCFKAFSP